MWAVLQTRTRATDVSQYGLLAFILDVGLNSFCLLLSITAYASNSILLNILLLTPAAYIYFQKADNTTLGKRRYTPKANNSNNTAKQSVSRHSPFVTAYRGGMMVITCLAILAVDFKAFPRRFAKAETWGTSLV